MSALEYMKKQLKKHRDNYERRLFRGASEEELYNIALKATYYKEAVEAIKQKKNENMT